MAFYSLYPVLPLHRKVQIETQSRAKISLWLCQQNIQYVSIAKQHIKLLILSFLFLLTTLFGFALLPFSLT